MNPVQGQGACGWSPHQDQVPGVDGSPTLPGLPAVETWQPPHSREYRSHVFTVSIPSNYEERGTEWGGRKEEGKERQEEEKGMKKKIKEVSKKGNQKVNKWTNQNSTAWINSENTAYKIGQKRANEMGHQAQSRSQQDSKPQQLSLRLWVWKVNDSKLPRLRDQQT